VLIAPVAQQVQEPAVTAEFAQESCGCTH
jgi:hypothetical protein